MFSRLFGSLSARPRFPEVDTLRTSGAAGSLVTRALARTLPQRELSLSAVCGDATGGRRGAVIQTFRSVGHVEDELEASGGGSAIPAQGAEKLDRQRTRGETRTSRARTDAEVSLSMFSLFCDANP